MAKLGILLLMWLLGAVILSPVVMAFDPGPMPGDFVLTLGTQHVAVPVVWSLCASGGLALLYVFLKR